MSEPINQWAQDLLLGNPWKCTSCDEWHTGLFDLGFDSPVYWNERIKLADNEDVIFDSSFLSSDLCVIDGEDFFVRCLLRIPVPSMNCWFAYGIWSSLSRHNFAAYVKHLQGAGNVVGSEWPSWLANDVHGTSTANSVEGWIIPQPDGARPIWEVHDNDHPLALAQTNGITAEQLLDIYRAAGVGPASH